jgi:hypothetical protein
MIRKRIVCSHRLRRIPEQFSWLDQRLVQRRYIQGRSHGSLALYLFLVTVADADGVSYYSDMSIRRYLRFTSSSLDKYRAELCRAGLVAYSEPFYQVVSLDTTLVPMLCETKAQISSSLRTHSMESIGQILKKAMEGAND